MPGERSPFGFGTVALNCTVPVLESTSGSIRFGSATWGNPLSLAKPTATPSMLNPDRPLRRNCKTIASGTPNGHGLTALVATTVRMGPLVGPDEAPFGSLDMTHPAIERGRDPRP